MPTPVSLPFLPKDVEELVLWRKPKDSGIIFGAATLAYGLWVINPFTVPSLLAYLLAIAGLAAFLWAQLGNLVSKSGPPVPAILARGLTEEEARKFAEAARPSVNKALAVVGVLASGKDLKTSSLVVVGAYIAARIFAILSPVAFVYVVVLLAFTLPKAYEAKQAEVDKVVAIVKSKVEEAIAKFKENVLSKIPKAAAPAPAPAPKKAL